MDVYINNWGFVCDVDVVEDVECILSVIEDECVFYERELIFCVFIV